jgi:hypothetical protein
MNSEKVLSTSIFNYNAYEYNGSLTLSSLEDIPEQSRIVAYCNDEIRGISTLLDYSEQLGSKYYALMIYSNQEYEEGFRLYYQENEAAMLVELDYGFAFESDMITGDFLEPMMIASPQNDNDDVLKYMDQLSVYPNPFNPETTLDYDLEEGGYVRIDIYNIRGQKVANLLNETQEAGIYHINWDASGLNSGIYLIRMNCGSYEQTIKAILLK